jgi:class 3 adenylate cyclase
MRLHLKISSFLFYGISGLMALVFVISFVNALSWMNEPFAGFLIYQPPCVGSISLSDWPGKQAGFSFLERVVTAEGKPVIDGRNVVSLARNKAPGTRIHYQIESKGQIREVSLPVVTFTVRDFILAFLVTFLGGAILFILGFVVVLLKPDIRPSWVFFALCTGVGGYMVTSFEILTTYTLVSFHYLALCFMPAPFLHLALVFPDRKRILDRIPFLEYAGYLPALGLAVLYQIHLFSAPANPGAVLSWLSHYKALGTAARIFGILCLSGLILSVCHSLYRASSPSARQRAKVILFGVTIAFLPTALIMMAFYLMKVNFPWNFLVFFIIFFPASIAYSIVRHNLFDADTIIRRTVGYAAVTAFVVAVYLLVGLTFNVLLGQYQVSQSKAFPILFTLVIILIFNPVRDRIQSLVDRIFFRKEYDYGKIIDNIGGAITSVLNLEQILEQLIVTFVKDMFVDTSSVMLLDTATEKYHVYLAGGEKKAEIEKLAFSRYHPLVRIIENEKRELTRYDVLEDTKYRKLREVCAENFDALQCSLIVPLTFKNEVIGLITLGDKKSGKGYNREDINLLRTLAKQGAVAIENARLADQMKKEEAARTNLARYLSPQIVDQVMRRNVRVNLGGNRKIVTVLFSDVRNFTRISETLSPDKLVALLNEYFTEMAAVIFEYQGSLDKFIGDAIVAVFGSLIPLENQAATAVRAAVRMMIRMRFLREKWLAQYGVLMEMGVGINTGEVFLGNVGSPERMEFTVLGDVVNVASRFSGLAGGGQILITKETLACLGSDVQWRELSPVSVKGKTGEIEIFEILYKEERSPPEQE